MSLLCIDVGNTRTSFGLFEKDALVDHWGVSTDVHRTADEWGVLLLGLLDMGTASDVEGICVCSTVPAVMHELRQMIGSFFADLPSVVLGPGVKTGLPVLMDNPREVGTDRVANAVAAWHLVGGPTVVVDLGTAITFDVVSAAGEYIGGIIAPGVEISLAALGEHAAQLRQVEIERPRAVIAKNTIEALQSGAVYGFAGQIDGIVHRICAALGTPVEEITVIATGVLDTAVVGECATIGRQEPFLTLNGLRLIFDRNTG